VKGRGYFPHWSMILTVGAMRSFTTSYLVSSRFRSPTSGACFSSTFHQLQNVINRPDPISEASDHRRGRQTRTLPGVVCHLHTVNRRLEDIYRFATAIHRLLTGRNRAGASAHVTEPVDSCRIQVQSGRKNVRIPGRHRGFQAGRNSFGVGRRDLGVGRKHFVMARTMLPPAGSARRVAGATLGFGRCHSRTGRSRCERGRLVIAAGRFEFRSGRVRMPTTGTT
jgi:hypothetical protein